METIRRLLVPVWRSNFFVLPFFLTSQNKSRSKGTGVGGDDTTDSPATTGIGAGLTAATAATATAATNQSNIVAGGGSASFSAASATIDTSSAFNGRQSRSRERVIFHQQPSLRSRHPLYHTNSLSSHSFLHSPQETHTFIRKKNRAIIADYVSRWIFPFSFIFLNICYWAVYLDWEERNQLLFFFVLLFSHLRFKLLQYILCWRNVAKFKRKKTLKTGLRDRRKTS